MDCWLRSQSPSLLSRVTQRLWQRTSSSTATSGRSSRTGVTRATGPTAPSGRPTCGWIRSRPAKAIHDGRRAIAAGDLEASELYQRITAEDDSERMPPVKSGKTLSTAEIERIGRWIAEGAKWQPHWAFIAPKSPPTPQVRHQDWLRNPIDAFILARLEREGLAPSPEAERGILIRRVTLDLTGLPPSRAEVMAFENDAGPNAYEKVVDRLLGSPALGERLASRWLNAARYADTSGYQTDGPRIMWRWRDWVIDAYNRNLPFDRFTIEQLAGDLLPSPTLDQKIATGFNRNHRGNSEGGHHSRGVRGRVRRRSRRYHGDGLAGLDARLRPLPQPQVRPDLPGGFLQVLRLLQQRPRERTGDQARQLAPDDPDTDPAQRQQLDTLQARLHDLERQAQARLPELATAQAQWESSLRERPPFDWFSEDRSRRSLIAWTEHWSRIKPSQRSNRASATASPSTLEVQSDRPSLSTAERSSTPATSPGSASSTSSRSAPGSRPTARNGGPSSRGWSTSRKPRGTASSSTRARSRSIS